MQLLLPPSPLHMQLLLPEPLLSLHWQLLSPLQLLIPIATLATVTALKSGGALPNGLTKPMLKTNSPTENELTFRAPVATTYLVGSVSAPEPVPVKLNSETGWRSIDFKLSVISPVPLPR